MSILRTFALVTLAFLLFAPAQAHAHATGENYVWLNVETSHLEGRFEIRLDDLRERLGIDIPDGEDEARQAVAASMMEAAVYLQENFEIRIDGEAVSYEIVRTDVTGEVPALGLFAQYFYRTAEIDVPDQLEIRNRILLDGTDRFHRSLLMIEYDRRGGEEYGEEFTALIFGPSNTEQTLDLTDVEGLLRVRDFIWQGVLHIWIGIDHVLFLIALLLTAVLTRRRDEDGSIPATLTAWTPVERFQSAFWTIVKIVTTFTIAHSVTLSLAALDVIRLPGRLVESIIALSIVLVALNNLFPKVREGHWVVIFFFGLFHGMGFASVMGDLPFRMMHLVQVILAFNIGVELGQVAIVAVAFPLLFVLRKAPFYKPVILGGGSAAIAVLAGWWFIERAFGL